MVLSRVGVWYQVVIVIGSVPPLPARDLWTVWFYRSVAAHWVLEFQGITVMSHEHHGILNHPQLNCLFNSLFRIRTMKPSKFWITGPFWGESTGRPVDSPYKWPVMGKAFPMLWGHRVYLAGTKLDSWVPLLFAQCSPDQNLVIAMSAGPSFNIKKSFQVEGYPL